jgi:hypothetical protein
MNSHQKCHYRDRLIVDTLTEWGTMNTEQIRILFFPSERSAQKRLQRLVEKRRIHRYRDALIPYMYFVRKYVRLVLNWARIWIMQRLKSWEVIDSFNYEANICTIRNTVQNTTKAINVLYNATKKTWLSGEVIVIYDTEKQKKESKVQGTLLTVDEIKEGLVCRGQCKVINS